MTIENVCNLIENGIVPDQCIFKLNKDKSAYSLDCIFNCININGEDKSITVHFDKVSCPDINGFTSDKLFEVTSPVQQIKSNLL